MASRRTRTPIICLLALVAVAGSSALAPAAMRSEKLDRNLCRTTGGGRFVDIPGFPGERVDRRLLPDVRYLVRRYEIFITDGYSRDGVHAVNGEHPLGLALDIVPDKANGGSWKLISRLARRVEPEQNAPVAPFRWVGYNGDAGHGRGNHLHLSWNHSPARPFHPARTVYTMRCPGATNRDGGGSRSGGGRDGDGKGDHRGGGGGVRPGGDDGGGGGVRPRDARTFERRAADPVVETGGAAAR
ncbi:MAG: hypothetical protein KJ006_00735 [Thermoleophilia bacterium]|nr:hypothetical protein [Thermoleophilia bacterium]GIK77865.1 MAG: hypothetical protein BroJett022_15550 [Actinomycetes bacterium]